MDIPAQPFGQGKGYVHSMIRPPPPLTPICPSQPTLPEREGVMDESQAQSQSAFLFCSLSPFLHPFFPLQFINPCRHSTQALCGSSAFLSSGQAVEEEELDDQMDLGGD